MTATRAPGGIELAITFLYYRDLERAFRFYAGVMGLPLVIDQGWAKIMGLGGGAHVGLVDESRGMRRAAASKPVQLCIRVADLDAWHAHARAAGVSALTEPRENAGLGIRAFVFEDPEGYQIEVQTASARAAGDG